MTHRTRRSAGLLAAAAATASLLASGAGSASGASATDGQPCARPQVTRARHVVQYCPLWRGNVPVYRSPAAGNNQRPVGHLAEGGSANWFVGDHYASRYQLGSYYHHWWAFTLADNGRWGWVPEVYFAGGGNDETDAGLYVCGSRGNRCRP
jgi:hypothetical protein